MNRHVSFSLSDLAQSIRFLTVDAVGAANSGHPGMPLGMADVAATLFAKHLRFSSQNPQWPDRDRFVLSAGHGSILLYSLLYLTGYTGITLEDIKNFRQLGRPTAGHPEVDIARGIETTTGPLGQGLANAVGIALAGKIARDRHGDNAYSYRTYCVVGDGCLMEGISQEAISFAGHYKLDTITVLFDDNGISIDGPTSLSTSENHLKRFEACGWQVTQIDGHDTNAIDQVLTWAKTQKAPTLIACKTQIGWGAPCHAGTSKIHGSPVSPDDITIMRHTHAWPYEAFMVPPPLLKTWRDLGKQYDIEADAWHASYGALNLSLDTPSLDAALEKHKQTLIKSPQNKATRAASSDVIEVLMDYGPQVFLGGSADLTSSNLTKSTHAIGITPDECQGNYIYYGIREHAMAAIMNGLALSGFRPFGGTFLAFSDYLRPALRLSALMHLPVIYVLTHDSIGLGEDGPTHQPIEHLAALRAMPNLHVFRPMDTVETLECWQMAVKNTCTPSVLALSRQNLPTLRVQMKESLESENLSSKGGYVLIGNPLTSALSLCATGSEVSLACQVHEVLKSYGIASHVVSFPWIEGFLQKEQAYKESCLPSTLPIFAIEAACSMGWERIIQNRGLFFGLDHFGASAPYQQLYETFGLTASQIVNTIRQYLEKMGEKHA